MCYAYLLRQKPGFPQFIVTIDVISSTEWLVAGKFSGAIMQFEGLLATLRF